MIPVTPLHSQETIAGALRNALQVAMLGSQRAYEIAPRFNASVSAFGSIERLLKVAIEGLSEPSLAAMQAGAILLKEWQGTPDERRQLRDTIQGILTAQLTGEIPKTWSEP